MKKSKKQQENAHLQNLIKREVTLCQEILSQMAQQEYCMLTGEFGVHDQLQMETQKLVKQLHALQKKRKEWIKAIIDRSLLHQDIIDLLDATDETDAETLIFLDKQTALISNIRAQEKRNASLYEMIQKKGNFNCSNEAVRSQIVYDNKKKKPLLITIDYPEETSS